MIHILKLKFCLLGMDSPFYLFHFLPENRQQKQTMELLQK